MLLSCKAQTVPQPWRIDMICTFLNQQWPQKNKEKIEISPLSILMTYRRRTARFSSSSEREACLVPPLCMGDSGWTNIHSCIVWSNIFKTKRKIFWDECLRLTIFSVVHLPSCSWHYLQSIFSLFSVDLKRKVNKLSLDTHCCLSSNYPLFTQAYWEKTEETWLLALERLAGLVWSVWLPVSSDWFVSSQTSHGQSSASGKPSPPGPDGDGKQPLV